MANSSTSRRVAQLSIVHLVDIVLWSVYSVVLICLGVSCIFLRNNLGVLLGGILLTALGAALLLLQFAVVTKRKRELWRAMGILKLLLSLFLLVSVVKEAAGDVAPEMPQPMELALVIAFVGWLTLHAAVSSCLDLRHARECSDIDLRTSAPKECDEVHLSDSKRVSTAERQDVDGNPYRSPIA
jgi:hypothetical protein